MISFKEEAIGYIDDELAQGYGLDQIKEGLVDEGYPPEVIDFAVKYVEKEHKVSEKDKKKEIPKTAESHMARHFHVPVMGIAGLVLALVVVFFLFGIGGDGEVKELPEKIDVFLYENLGLRPESAQIKGSDQLFSRSEKVDTRKATAFLEEQKASAVLGNLILSKTVSGFKKRATVFNIIDGGAKKKTLIEIRFQADRDSVLLKIIEVLPEDLMKDVELTQAGVKSGPALMFTLRNVRAGEAQKVVYVVNKEISELETMTFPAVEVRGVAKPTQAAVCGDGVCVPGESYQVCCMDCGCPSGFVCEKNVCASPVRDECQQDTDCDDYDVSTKDTCTGVPRTCHNTAITSCSGGDGYCPPSCSYDTDADCPEQVVEEVPEETVDITGLNITGPQESPKINQIKITPTNVSIGDEIVIEARVIDDNGKDDIERVWYEVLELAQSHGEIGDMNDIGEDGDRAADDNYYTTTAMIGEHYLAGYYHMVVFAQDLHGNKKKIQKVYQVSNAAEGDE
ncbi:hypothetical protein ACFL3V_02235 [Nanoarchaeota archaeon]